MLDIDRCLVLTDVKTKLQDAKQSRRMRERQDAEKMQDVEKTQDAEKMQDADKMLMQKGCSRQIE